MTIPYIDPEVTYNPSIVVALIIGTILIGLGIFGTTRTSSSADKVGFWMMILGSLSLSFAYYLTFESIDSDIEVNQAALTQQSDQIRDTYGLGALDIDTSDIPLCSVDNSDKPQRANATWNNGYGTVVVGARQGDGCEVSVFEENGRKLEPVK